MKKTISVKLGKEDFIIAIMKAIGFVEESRISCGGTMSEERLQITFEGKESDYHERGYIEELAGVIGSTRYSYFYSILFPDGTHEKGIENFKERTMKFRSSSNFVVKLLDQ